MRFASCLTANAVLHAGSVIAARRAARRAKKKREASFASVTPLKSGLRRPTTAPNWGIGKLIPLLVKPDLPA